MKDKLTNFFSYSGYKDFLNYAKQFKIVPLCEFDGSNCIILRHDVDFDVMSAYKLAKIEYEVGVKSTYLFLTTGYTYNILAEPNRSLIREISKMGMEVGLHFDPSIYKTGDLQKLKKYVDMEAEMISFVAGQKVRSISLHNPSIHNQYPLFSGYVNSYDTKIFGDDKYISDSCMDFRGKDIYSFVTLASYKPIQILLHPMHFSETGEPNYLLLMRRYFENFIGYLNIYFSKNSKYQMDIGDLNGYICFGDIKNNSRHS